MANGCRRAQASVEFLLLLGIAVFILATSVVLSKEQIGDISKMKEQNDARNALLDISAAAKEVYAQGEGSKKEVFVELPTSYEPGGSYVENRTIVIRVRGTDHVAVHDFEVHGNLPATSGAHWVSVMSEGNRVRIGNAMLATNRNSVYVIMGRNDTTSASFEIRNIWGSPLNVSQAATWTALDVTMYEIPSGGFQLGTDESTIVYLTFGANGDSVGYYNGKLEFTADDGFGNTEELEIPITVEVVGSVSDPRLTVTPDYWGETMEFGDTRGKNFTICTNSYTSVTSVNFTTSSGPPGSWVEGTEALGPIPQGGCIEKQMTITVPFASDPGTYQGTIEVVGEGAAGAEDSVTIFIVVQEIGWSGFMFDNATGYCNCPVGSGYSEIPICNCQPATIYVINGTVQGGPDDGQPYNGTLRGSSGEDVIVGTNQSDYIYTDTGNDRVCGMEGDDIIYGSNSNDIMHGGEGDDILYGEGSGDLLYGGPGYDLIYGGQGTDQIDGGDDADEIYGEAGDELIFGGTGNDHIYGGDGKDTVCGNGDDDTIYGDVNDDRLDGGTGTNTLNGGGDNGDDCYRYSTVSECANQMSGELGICGPT